MKVHLAPACIVSRRLAGDAWRLCRGRNYALPCQEAADRGDERATETARTWLADASVICATFVDPVTMCAVRTNLVLNCVN
jgi:hypothetical protein